MTDPSPADARPVSGLPATDGVAMLAQTEMQELREAPGLGRGVSLWLTGAPNASVVGRVGDTRDSAPENWLFGSPQTPVHAVVCWQPTASATWTPRLRRSGLAPPGTKCRSSLSSSIICRPTIPLTTNDFNFEQDPTGDKTSVCAHIRKVYPGKGALHTEQVVTEVWCSSATKPVG